MTKPYFKAANWNKIDQPVDKSAWSRLNDIVYEPTRVPVKKDKLEFLKLPENERRTLLRTFATLSLTSTLQMEKGIDSVKKDAVCPEEAAVFNALQYLESINNKAYSYALEELGGDEEATKMLEWIQTSPYLQKKLYFLNSIYQGGSTLQKKAVQVITSTGLYESSFFASLYLFGQGLLPQTAELMKYALRVTSFNGMYPGIKFRMRYDKLSENEQKNVQEWISKTTDEFLENEKKHIDYLYQDTDWADMVYHYVRYSLNKALMNLGQPIKYPETADTIDPVVMQGLIQSADSDDFFFYTNRHALIKMKDVSNPKNK